MKQLQKLFKDVDILTSDDVVRQHRIDMKKKDKKKYKKEWLYN